MDATLVIPALNEEESLGQVLEAVDADLIREIILVDGGSSDRTVDIAKANGARVIQESRRGYGRACITPIKQEGADMGLGSRLAGVIFPGAMPWHQKFGNRLSAGMIRLLYGLPITDLSPFRAVRRTRLLELNMQEMTYGWPTEMITKSAGKGWRIAEVPVNYHPRIGGRSKISGTIRGTFLATYYIFRTILKYSRPEGRS